MLTLAERLPEESRAARMPSAVDQAVPNVPVRAVQVGILAGFFTCLSYPLFVFAPLPKLALITLAAGFGPALGVASYGLCQLLDLDAPRGSPAAWARC